MKLSPRISRLSIGQQVMLTALLPLLLLTFALSGYMISSRIQDAQQALDNETEILMDFLSSAAEFGLLTQNADALELLIRGPMKRPEISNIMFVNAQSALLYQSHALALDFERIVSQGASLQPGQRTALPGLEHSWLVVKEVVMSAVTVDDFDLSRAPERTLGSVVLIINDSALLQRQQQIVIWGVIISLAGLLLAMILALRIGRNISEPVRTLSQALINYRSGDGQPEIRDIYQQEIGALQQGVRELIDQAQRHQQSLQNDVDKATMELQQALRELEQSHSKLQRSKERIEQTGRAKDDFMARMSHELRTPISSVIGFIRLLEKSPLNDGQREYCRIILSASSLLLRLIDDILDFSKFQSDNLTLERISFNPELCIEDVIEMQAPAAAQKGLEIELQCEAQWPLLLMGDPTRFSQIISNLISNAIKFTEKGRVQVRLSGCQEQGRTRLRIDIEDTGIGIAAAELRTLFQPFAQADTSISRRFGGSGLGLVICKRLVDMMQGELTLSSVSGQGSQFSIELCLDQAPESPIPSLPGLNILLCCSDPECSQQLERQLSDWGCRVDAIPGRQQLVSTIRASKYDAVLIHLALEELKALSWSRFLSPVRACFAGKLILITEHDSDDLALDGDQLIEQLSPALLLRQPVGRYRLFSALQARGLPNAQPLSPSLPLQGVKVLVVEDNRFNRLLLMRMLQAQGAEVATAANGRDAVKEVEQGAVDLIIMDLHMPIMGGMDACRAIRKLSKASAAQTPILILTADVISNEAGVLESLALKGILYKPVDEPTLVSQALRAINKVDGQPCSDVAMRLQRFGIPEQELQQALAEQFNALEQALTTGNSALFRDQAHQLCGLAVMAGLNQLDERVRALSGAVKEEQIAMAWELYRSIKEDFDASDGVFDLS